MGSYSHNRLMYHNLSVFMRMSSCDQETTGSGDENGPIREICWGKQRDGLGSLSLGKGILNTLS